MRKSVAQIRVAEVFNGRWDSMAVFKLGAGGLIKKCLRETHLVDGNKILEREEYTID